MRHGRTLRPRRIERHLALVGGHRPRCRRRILSATYAAMNRHGCWQGFDLQPKSEILWAAVANHNRIRRRKDSPPTVGQLRPICDINRRGGSGRAVGCVRDVPGTAMGNRLAVSGGASRTHPTTTTHRAAVRIGRRPRPRCRRRILSATYAAMNRHRCWQGFDLQPKSEILWAAVANHNRTRRRKDSPPTAGQLGPICDINRRGGPFRTAGNAADCSRSLHQVL